MNWLIISIVGILVLSVFIFLIIRNKKDEAEFEEELNKDYSSPRDEIGDTDIDELTKNVH